MKILVFGNPAIDEDILAIKLVEELRIPGVEFFIMTDPSELVSWKESKLVIMDVAEGIDDVMVIDDLEKLKTIKSTTAHDVDLAFFLKLLKCTGRLEDVRIIALPKKGRKEEILQKLKGIIKTMQKQ